MDLVLETGRLILRRFVAADIDRLFSLHNDPEVMRFLTGGEPISRAEIERDYRQRFANDGYWAAVERASGAFVGWFALHPTPERDPAEFELGYRLRKEFWGNGYAAEGSRALIGNAFAARGARRIWAQTMAVHRASRRVMEKSGLKYVRTFHLAFDDPLPGTELGEVEYALDRADWERRQPDLLP
ncbi:MAG TPA: GNAT family N-acetyltransferase [Thermomicrobiales bacterium]|nr:GNAT family N-acetyltransferase [Thermomicrobiales bacterium]